MRLIKRPEVEAKTGMSRSSIYLAISKGTFPPPVEAGPNSVAWVESEVDAWIEQRIAARESRPRKLNSRLVAAREATIARGR